MHRRIDPDAERTHQDESDKKQSVSVCLFGTEAEDQTRITMAIVWSIVHSAWCFLPHLTRDITSQPLKITKESVLFGALFATCIVTWTHLCVFLWGQKLDRFVFIGPLVAIVSMSGIVAQYHHPKTSPHPTARLYGALAWSLGYVTVVLETHAMTKLLRQHADPIELFILRFVLHILTWCLVDTLVRHSRRLSGVHDSLIDLCHMLPFKTCRSLYGWYIVLQMGSVLGYIHCLLGCLALYQITSTVANKSKDLWLLKFLHGKPAAEVLVASRAETLLDLANSVADFLSDGIGLMVVGSLTWWSTTAAAQISPEHAPFRQLPMGTLISLAASLAIFVHLVRLLLTDHLHQGDVGQGLAQLPTVPVLLYGIYLIVFICLDVALRALSPSCIDAIQNRLQFCD